MSLLKKLHNWFYKDMVYSVSADAWFYQEGAAGEWVD